MTEVFHYIICWKKEAEEQIFRVCITTGEHYKIGLHSQNGENHSIYVNI